MSDKRNDNIFGEPIELGEPDKIEWAFVEKSKYEALLAEALKLEAALEKYADPKNWRDQDPYVSTPCIFEPKDSSGWGPCGKSAREALAQFKKWRGGE